MVVLSEELAALDLAIWSFVGSAQAWKLARCNA